MKVIIAFLFVVLHSLSLSAKDSLSLYIFLLDDCPICIQYTPTLNNLYNEYQNQISFIGYFPNFSSKKEKIEIYKNQYKIQFPLETDYFKTQAKKFKAKVTPEVVLYNHTSQQVIYQGRIDNEYYKLGRRRKVVTEHSLKDAIEQTLAQKKITTRYTEPIGCFINYSDNFRIKPKDDPQ